MSFKEVIIEEQYIPVYYWEGSKWTGEYHDSREDALGEIEWKAHEAVFDREDKFDYAEIELKYVPKEFWDWDEE